MSEAAPTPAEDDDAWMLRLAAQLAWRDEPAAVPLPTVLTRPPLDAPVGMLDYAEPAAEHAHLWPKWKITGSAHAVLMARKLFGSESDSSVKHISFPATLGNFDELLLLLHRFHLKLTEAAQIIFDRMYRQLVAERHIAASVPAETASGWHFKGKLLPFQTEGVAFLCAVRKGLLADDMGLGKTVQAFGFLDRINAYPAAIVVQSHVQRHWENKLPEFMRVRAAGDLTPGDPDALTFIALNGAKRLDATPPADIYIVHYLVLFAWAPLLIERGVRTVIFDECQELRHPGTRKHDACTALSRKAENVAGLSGTPIYNHGTEIHTVINTMERGALGTRADFERNWCTYVAHKLVVADPAVLGEYLRDRKLMLRRRKEEVQLELPAKRRVIEPIAGDHGIFADLVSKAAELAKEAADITDPFDRARMEQEAIHQTRRATAMAKLPAVIAFLRGLMEAAEPTLCFLHHHALTDGILEALDKFAPACITGREDKNVKAEAQRRFVDGETNLCLISLRVATGLDGLQARARVVVFAELDWSPAIHRQAEDRAHRMGQRDSVLAYYLVTDLGTDPFVMATLNLKASQFTGLMSDRAETDDDRRDSEQAAKQHMEGVLKMLRSGGAS